MLRYKHRKANITTIPYRIRYNFRRLPNRISDILSDNYGSETMLQKYSEDDNVCGEEHDNENSYDDDDLEQRSDNDDDDDDLE
jgi:hypothetical protein